MHTNTFKLLAVLFAVSFLLNDEAAELKRDIPKATWEPLFFEDINQLATKADWKSLREMPLPSGSLEVRIWIGFGLSPLEGYSIRRDGSHWTGCYIVAGNQLTNSISVRSVIPKSGWTNFWATLVQLDLLTLPDSSTLPDQQWVLDGVCYVVEINQDGRYRTYEYSNPDLQKWPEAKKIIQIVQTLRNEFAKR